jgi:hypothetical protein
MEFKFNEMGKWELEKGITICQYAMTKLKWDLTGFGECRVNQNSGNTYLWLEQYPVSLYLPISFDGPINENIWVLYSDAMNGEEYEMLLSEFESMDAIYKWVEELEQLNSED